jgi:hypothetical protein
VTEPLTPEAEVEARGWHTEDEGHRARKPECLVCALLATLDVLRASLDPDNEAAVEAWAAALHERFCGDLAPHERYSHLPDATALLRARAEAKRP